MSRSLSRGGVFGCATLVAVPVNGRAQGTTVTRCSSETWRSSTETTCRSSVTRPTGWAAALGVVDLIGGLHE